MNPDTIQAVIGALGTVAAAFVGVLTWYLASSADRRRERDERDAQRRAEEQQRKQRVLDLVVALHSEILAGVVANRRQLTPEDVEYALKQTNPFTTADETDFVFDSLKGDISILPAEVIHSVVQYYRVALQSNLVTKDLRDPYFLAQPVKERQRVIAFLLQIVELQKMLGEEAIRDLASYAKGFDIDLAANERRAMALIERASGELAAVFKKSDKSGRKSLLPRAVKPLTSNISTKPRKEK
jgi:hypothetical protein